MADQFRGHNDDALRLAYELSLQRLIEADAKLWQVPGLSLTAQAFLLTIALGSANYTAAERLVAATLGLVVALAAIQLMERHRFHAACDVTLLKHIESTGTMPHLVDREAIPGAPSARGWSSVRSAIVWEVTMALFGVANLGIGLVVLLRRG